MFCPLNEDNIQAQTSEEYIQSLTLNALDSGIITRAHMSNNRRFAVSLLLVFFCLFA